MAWPVPAGGAPSWSRTAGTVDPSVDSVLWDMLCARSPFLALLDSYQVDNSTFSYETASTVTRTYTEPSSGSTTIDGSGSGTALVLTGGADIEVGSLLRNATRPSPVGTFLQDEILEVVANDGASPAVLTVVRDAGRQNGGTGFASHALGDTFEVIAEPKQEGSDPGKNRLTEVTLETNFTEIVDFSISVTGSRAAAKTLVAGDSLERQLADRLREKRNELERLALYGCLNNSAAAGSNAAVRRTKGAAQFMCVSGGNVDYTTKDVTEPALNKLFENIVVAGTDETDRFAIVAHPSKCRQISAFGADKVRVERTDTTWGRYINTYESDLGIVAKIIPSMNVSKSDVFILDVNKIRLAVFRPWQKWRWGQSTNGSDTLNFRYLTEVGFEIVDGVKSHGMLTGLSWS